MILVLIFCLVSCGSRSTSGQSSEKINPAPGKNFPKIAEVSPPQVIQELGQVLDSYKPQVTILSPQPEEILEDNTATVKFQVKDLPIFKNTQLGLGPHLHVFLDNRPYMEVYDLNEPLIFKDLEPGTHTLRVFASRPWDESFKNQGAYSQTTFHIFTKTDDNNPNPQEALLTYSRPQGSYGAEPIMLDFYLVNAPMQPADPQNPDNLISDWQIRCTIDGTSFIIQDWQPIYLTGFQPGKNWVQLELIDKQGNPIKNVYNNSVRLITYEPGGNDSLSQLVKGELTVADARGIVDPNYTPPPPPEPTPIETSIPEVVEQPETTPTETLEAEPITSDTPALEETSIPEKVEESPTTVESSEPEPKEIGITKPLENPQPAGFYNRVISPEVTQKPTPTKELEQRKFGGFFNRYRRSDDSKLPLLVAPKSVPTSEPIVSPVAVPQPEIIPEPTTEVIETPTKETPELEAKETESAELNSTDLKATPSLPEAVETSTPEPTNIEAIAPVETKSEDKIEEAGNVETESTSELTPKEITATPVAVEILPETNTDFTETNTEEIGELTKTNSPSTTSALLEETSSSNLPTNTPTSATEVPQVITTQPKTEAEAKIEPSKAAPALVKTKPNNIFSKFFDRFRRSPAPPVTPPPSLPPTLPEIINPPTPESVVIPQTITPEQATPESVVIPPTTTSQPAALSETVPESETSAADSNLTVIEPTTESEVTNLDLDVETDQSEQDNQTPEVVEPTEPSEAPGVRKEA